MRTNLFRVYRRSDECEDAVRVSYNRRDVRVLRLRGARPFRRCGYGNTCCADACKCDDDDDDFACGKRRRKNAAKLWTKGGKDKEREKTNGRT